MSIVPKDADRPELTIAARRVLLDALTALDQHRNALVLVGAQAVYLHSQDANLAVAMYTSDGDLGIDPQILQDDPRLEDAMAAAGFTRNILGRQAQPGTWFRTALVNGQETPIPVDLLAPDSLAEGSRAAKLPPHAQNTVRLVPGIELAVEDHNLMPIISLEPECDPRTVTMRVAGPSALMVAKAFKIRDRLAGDKPGRVSDKDASDVYRLMTTIDPYLVADTLTRLASSPRVGAIAREGIALLHHQFGTPRAPGVDMAIRALEGSVRDDRIRDVATTYFTVLPEPAKE